jgi:hypothetical protein
MYKTENEIKMVLGLNAWRNLLQDKVVLFAQMMTNIDTALTMKLAGELPQLRDFARQTINHLEKAFRNEQVQQKAGRPEPEDLAWESTLTQVRKLIALDFHDNLPRELAKDKLLLLAGIESRLASVGGLYNYDDTFLRGLCKRNQDDLRTFVLASLVYMGGCMFEPSAEDFES